MNIQSYLEQKHPRLYTACSLARDAWRFLFCGFIVLSLSRWLVTTCGRIAESALLFCILWITSQSVAPELFQPLGESRITTLTSVTLLLLALLPEIVLFSAIITTLERLQVALARRTPESWTWAILFLLPTLAFFAMTLYTLTTLALSGEIVRQAHWAVVTRVVFAWMYALTGIVHASWKQMCTQGEQQVNTPLPGQSQEAIEQLSQMVIQLVEERLAPALPSECSPEQIEVFTSVHSGEHESEQSEQSGEQESEQGVQVDEMPILCVPGICQDKVNQILTLHLSGTPWREIPGNYGRTIKPVKEAYESYTQGEQVNR